MAIQLQAVVAMNTAAFTSGLSGMTAQIGKFGGMAMMMFGGVAGQAAAMWAAFGPMGAVAVGLKSIIDVGSTFEQSMQNVKSVTGLVGEEFARVSTATREAAEQTGFTAAEAGEAMYSLGSAGMSTAEVLEATLLPALKLAEATQSETKLATEAMTAAMAIWKLGAEDAVGVANMFAGAIASSPATMERLSDAMKYAGTAGAGFSMSLKQVVDEVAAFHTVGLRGQMAGTAFRMALIKLSEASTTGAGEVGKAMKGWDSATEGLTGAVRRLEAAGIPAASVIQELGARAGPGMAALLKIGSAAMGDLSAKVTANSNVSKMYEIQMASLGGKFKLFKALVEETAQKLFVSLAPAFVKILAGMKNLVSTITMLAEKFSWLLKVVVELLPLLVGGSGLLFAFGKLAAIGPSLGMSMTAIFVGMKSSIVPAAASMTKLAATTMPMVATSSLSLAKAMNATRAGFFQLTPAVMNGVHKMELMTGAVTRVSAAQARAIPVAKAHMTALQGLGVVAMAAASAFAGWKMGGWIREIKLANGTIGDFFDSMAIMFTGQYAAMEANDAEIASIKRLTEQRKKESEEKKKSAEASVEAAAKLQAAIAEQSRASDIAREALMAKMRAEKDAGIQTDILATSNAEAGAAIAGLAEAIAVTDDAQRQSVEAANLLAEAENGVKKAVEEQVTAQQAVADAVAALSEAERADIDVRGKLHAATMNNNEALMGFKEDTAEAMDAAAGLTAAEGNAATSADALTAAKKLLEDAQLALAESSDGVTVSLKDVDDAINELNKAIDRNITETNVITELVQYYGKTFDDARKMMKDFKDQAVEVESRSRKLGISIEEAGRDVLFIANNLGMAGKILKEKYGDKIVDVTAHVKKFGASVMEITAYAFENKVSFEVAAVAVRKMNAALADGTPKAESAISSMSKLGKETLNFGRSLSKINKAKLDEIYAALKDFAGNLALLPDLDLSWMRDLAALRLPPIGNADNWGNYFDKLVAALKKAVGLNLTLDWMKPLSEFRLPNLGKVDNWKGQWINLVDALDAAKKPDLSWIKDIAGIANIDLEQLKSIVAVLTGLKAGTYNASVLIGWQDNASLSSIDSSLNKLVAMKGLIWA
jgi:TP901 family phage tail tape measure protein